MRTLIISVATAAGLVFASSAFASRIEPKPDQSASRDWEDAQNSGYGSIRTKQGAVGDTVWIKVQNDSACSFTNNNLYGSRGVTSPGWSVWCFDGGLGDTCSSTTAYDSDPNLPGCWTHYDGHIFGQANRWHVDTYDTYIPGSEDSSFWCGERGDTLTWEWPPGYGPSYGYSLILNLGNSAAFNAAAGCTIECAQLFSIELAYDYCFLEMSASGTVDTAVWAEVARYNGISNPDSVNCRGLGASYWGTTQLDGIGDGISPYLCADWANVSIPVSAAKIAALGQNSAENLFVRWRVDTDLFWDDRSRPEPEADTRGAWRVDHLRVKGNGSSYFPGGDPLRTDVVDFENAGCPPANPLCEPGRSAISTPLLPVAERPGGYWAGNYFLHGKPAVVDLWHLTNTPTYPSQAQTCLTSNRWVWASNLNPAGVDGNVEANGFDFRLASPVFDLSPTSVLTAGTPLSGSRVSSVEVTYDRYFCAKQVSADIGLMFGRGYIGTPVNAWKDLGLGLLLQQGCQFWRTGERVSWFLAGNVDSIQFSFSFFDACDYNATTAQDCMPGVYVSNPHRKNTFLLDNFSIGLFDHRESVWYVTPFHDTFARNIFLHTASVENWELFPAHPRDLDDSLSVEVLDIDGLVPNSIVMHYRISTNCGANWSHESSRPQGSKAKPSLEWYTKTLNFSAPGPTAVPGQPSEFDGIYRTTLELNATDFPGGQLSGGLMPAGTVVEYYLTSRDLAGSRDTVPARAALNNTFIHPQFGTERQDPWPYEVTVLPCNPPSAYTAQGGKAVLLVDDSDGIIAYDAESDPTLAGVGVEVFPGLFQLYEEALRDLNVKFDRYDLSGALSTKMFYIEPTNPRDYGGIRDPQTATHRYQDVLWTSSNFNYNTISDSSTLELSQYLSSDANEANIWFSDPNICEDENLFGIAEAFNGGNFAVNYIGASLVAGGCPDNDGIAQRTYYVEGIGDPVFTPFQSYGGWSDCPIRIQPDSGFEINTNGQGTETVVLQFDNAAHSLNETAGILNVQPGAPNKMLTTMFTLGNITTRAARACLTRAILTKFGVTIPAGGRYSAANCAKPVGVPIAGPVRKFALEQNYPNPFNPTTKIRYSLPKDNMRVVLTIIDVSGREVRRLVNRSQSGAQHDVFWDGKNDLGTDVASGVYFCRLTADDHSSTKKIVLLK